MKICVLQPDYSTSDVDYQYYDPRRDLTALLPGHTVDHVALNKLTTYRQLKQLARQGYDIFVNLCEGYPEWEVPGVDVVDTLARLGLPHTGPTPALYDVPKAVMKYVAYAAGVRTPAHAIIRSGDDLPARVAALRYPLFVKPSHAGDSLGVDHRSLVRDAAELTPKAREIVAEYGEALVEEYIDGREITVLVVNGVEEHDTPTALTPIEFIFPKGLSFKTYALKTSELHPEANIPVCEPELAERAKDAAVRIFRAFGGVGYARFDFRVDAAGALFFLEINFTCSVFYRDGYEGSADYVLKHDPLGAAGFAERIIAEGIARHRRAQRPFEMRGNAIAGYGIFARDAIPAGTIVFRGEGRAQRMVTRRHVDSWSAAEQEVFRRYAYPLSDQLFLLWDADPTEWAPENHSCEPNTRFDGLDVVATRAIAAGEELTLDYAEFMNEESEPFTCHCGAASCRGLIKGTPGNSVTSREHARTA